MAMNTGTASNNGVTLAWSRWPGGHTPLLLINGLGSPQVAWEPGFIEALTDEGFDVVRFDNRDVGASSRCPDESYTMADMAADAVAVLDANGIDRTVVWGMSMGGMIGQQLTIDHPDRVSHLVSMMSAATMTDDVDPEIAAEMMEPPPMDRDGWLAYRVRTENLWASPKWRDSEWQLSKAKAIWDVGVDPAGVQRQYEAILRSPDRTEALGGLDIPTLVIHGDHDTLLPPVLGERTAKAIPGAEMLLVAGMGHDLPPDQWRPLATSVANLAQSE